MRLLLDTHTLVWALRANALLSSVAQAVIENSENDVFVSVVSAWEIAIKVGQGKWPDAQTLIENFESEIETPRFRLLQIALPHVRLAGLMSLPHRDPFDRLLAAQAEIEGLALVTADQRLQVLGVEWIW